MNLFAYVGGDPVNFIDPWGLLTAHIWNYRGKDEAWGHVSITLENGTHISWWPEADGRERNRLFPQLYRVDAFQNQTLAKDIEYEGQTPDESIRILGLDETAIANWWIKFKNKNKWKTLSQNCSTTVSEALKKGGADVLWRDFFDAHNMIWTPEDVKKFVEAIIRYQQAQVGENHSSNWINPDNNTLWNPSQGVTK